MKRRFLGQTLWFWLGAVGVFALIQGFFLLSRFDIPVISTIGGAYAQRIFLASGVMAIVALGLNLIYGFNGQFSLGQWGLYAIGAYTAADITYRWNRGDSSALLFVLFAVLLLGLFYSLVSRLIRSRFSFMDEMSRFTLYLISTGLAVVVSGLLASVLKGPVNAVLGALPKPVSVQIVFFIATLCAGAVSGLIAYLFGQPVLKLGGDYFGIATLGLTMVVFVLANNSDKVFPEMKGSRGMVGIPTVTTWFWVFVFLLAALIVMRNLLDSSHGRAVISVREDEIAAKTMGVDTTQYKTLAFVIGSFFAGLAGSLFAHQEGFLHPSTFNFVKSFDPLIIIVFGGLGSITGTVLASFVWGLVLFYLLPTVLPQGGEGWRFVIYAIALLIIMLLRQQGLLGGKEWGFLKSTRWPLSGKLGGGGGGTAQPVREPMPAGARSVATPGAEVEVR
jgi:branched-chain amino acid transport system permease protein